MRVSSDLYEDDDGSEAITGKQALILVARDAKNNVVALCSGNKDFFVRQRNDSRLHDQGFPDSSQPVRNFVDAAWRPAR
jgi:hypothetical protein